MQLLTKSNTLIIERVRFFSVKYLVLVSHVKILSVGGLVFRSVTITTAGVLERLLLRLPKPFYGERMTRSQLRSNHLDFLLGPPHPNPEAPVRQSTTV